MLELLHHFPAYVYSGQRFRLKGAYFRVFVGGGRSSELEMPLIADCCALNSTSVVFAVTFVLFAGLENALLS